MRNTLKFASLLLASSLLLAAPLAAFAYDGTITGTISQIDVNNAYGDEYAVRVYMGGAALCGNANTWAYVNSNDTNYSSFLAALLSAKAQGETLIVMSNQDSGGFCHIVYLSLK